MLKPNWRNNRYSAFAYACWTNDATSSYVFAFPFPVAAAAAFRVNIYFVFDFFHFRNRRRLRRHAMSPVVVIRSVADGVGCARIPVLTNFRFRTPVKIIIFFFGNPINRFNAHGFFPPTHVFIRFQTIRAIRADNRRTASGMSNSV